MPRGAFGLPSAITRVLSKRDLLAQLREADVSVDSRARVLAMENGFRRRIDGHVTGLPAGDALFQKFNTSPYVLLIHAKSRRYQRISEIERDILPAKQFSSMETSAGRMIEEIALPIYGWACVASEMHTSNSALDGRKTENDVLRLATLKSGPRCLNDEMSENFADAIVNHTGTWSRESDRNEIDFTYGVLYGTQKSSNKKDWHILRNIREKKPAAITLDPANRWDCAFSENGVRVKVTVRIGLDWWEHLGGHLCFIEVFSALIRACIAPGDTDPAGQTYAIRDLARIVATEPIATDYNVALLQRGQLPWLFLTARHFCDELVD